MPELASADNSLEVPSFVFNYIIRRSMAENYQLYIDLLLRLPDSTSQVRSKLAKNQYYGSLLLSAVTECSAHFRKLPPATAQEAVYNIIDYFIQSIEQLGRIRPLIKSILVTQEGLLERAVSLLEKCPPETYNAVVTRMRTPDHAKGRLYPAADGWQRVLHGISKKCAISSPQLDARGVDFCLKMLCLVLELDLPPNYDQSLWLPILQDTRDHKTCKDKMAALMMHLPIAKVKTSNTHICLGCSMYSGIAHGGKSELKFRACSG